MKPVEMQGVQFLLLEEEDEPCRYLPDQRARMPLRLPMEAVPPDAFDRLLAEGDRRSGPMLYRVACRSCRACEPLRVPVARFSPSRSQRRTMRRNEDLRVEFGAPRLTERHLELYNRHKVERALGTEEDRLDAQSYYLGFIESCVDTVELRYLAGERLIAVSLLDLGSRSASSVYHYFDPDEAKRSLGVFSAVREIELCRELGLEWYYLGLYAGACASLAYKAQYLPHQRLVDGEWREFGAPG